MLLSCSLSTFFTLALEEMIVTVRRYPLKAVPTSPSRPCLAQKNQSTPILRSHSCTAFPVEILSPNYNFVAQVRPILFLCEKLIRQEVLHTTPGTSISWMGRRVGDSPLHFLVFVKRAQSITNTTATGWQHCRPYHSKRGNICNSGDRWLHQDSAKEKQREGSCHQHGNWEWKRKKIAEQKYVNAWTKQREMRFGLLLRRQLQRARSLWTPWT